MCVCVLDKQDEREREREREEFLRRVLLFTYCDILTTDLISETKAS